MVHIVQLLCPSRHCIVAAAYDPADYPDGVDGVQFLRTQFEDLVAARALNRKCGICGSTDLSYEDGVTRYRTMAEASPALHAVEEAQRQTRAFIDRSRN